MRWTFSESWRLEAAEEEAERGRHWEIDWDQKVWRGRRQPKWTQKIVSDFFIMKRYAATNTRAAAFIILFSGVWVRKSAFNIKMMTSLTLVIWTSMTTKVKRRSLSRVRDLSLWAMEWAARPRGERVEELARSVLSCPVPCKICWLLLIIFLSRDAIFLSRNPFLSNTDLIIIIL